MEMSMPIERQALCSARRVIAPADFAVSSDLDIVLSTSQLGSCLGVAMYDPIVRVGGLMHSLLPNAELDPLRAASRPAMFLDTGFAALLAAVQKLNVQTKNLLVSVAGGAEFLGESPVFCLGRNNFAALAKLLSELGFRIYAQAVGGRTNCSMELTVATGEVRLRYAGQVIPKILCRP